MLRSTLYLLTVALIATSYALPATQPFVLPSSKEATQGNVNHLVDVILIKVNRNLPDYIELGDLGGPFDFTDCIFLGTANGIHRDGDATFYKTGNIAQFQMPFKMTEVGINCTWHYSELLMSGKANVLTQKVDIGAGMGVIIQHGQHPYLTEFIVEEMTPLTTDIGGLTPAFNWLAEDIADFILKEADQEITYVIENVVSGLFQDVLDTLVIP